MIGQELRYCSKCQDTTIHNGEKVKFNWILHFILFLLTGFLWLIPFLFYYMAKKDKLVNCKCTVCGKRVE